MRIDSASELTNVPRKRIWICFGLFFCVDFLLVCLVWSFEGETLPYVVGLLLAQCAVAAVVALAGNMPEIIRYALPTLATLGSVFVLIRILPLGVGGDAVPKITLLMSGHTLATMAGMVLYRQVREYRALRLSFSLSTLFTWTTLTALAISLGSGTYKTWGLTLQAVTSPEAVTSLLVGVFCGVSSLVWVHAFWTSEQSKRITRLAIGFVIAVGGSYVFAHGVNRFRSGEIFVAPQQFATIMMVLGIIFAGSMLAMLIHHE